MKELIEKAIDYLKSSTAGERVRHQLDSSRLLMEKYNLGTIVNPKLESDNLYQELKKILTKDSVIFKLNPVQKEIYHSDSGTAFIPEKMKKVLLNTKTRFVIRPVTLDDLQQIVQFSRTHKLRYTIRGAGTWPFGGAVPQNNDMVIDLSCLNFHNIYEKEECLVVGPGVIFADMRKELRNSGFILPQEITNPNSGTICGWIATGGLGLGTYKYGHIKESIQAILLLTPDGAWHTLKPEDELFEHVFSSEGQIGIIAGVLLRIRKLSFVGKPYAFSFEEAAGAQSFMQLISEWKLNPTTVLYFDREYIETTYEIGKERIHSQLNRSLQSEDETIIKRLREELEVIEQYTGLNHVVVLEFDAREDYQQSLKFQPFSSATEHRRYKNISYKRLPVSVAHKLWEHRFLPVEMKPKGPAMLVSESILPLDRLADYLDFVQSSITYWTQNPVKSEAHLINSNEVLIQTIILADPDVRRHVFYLGLVPFMTQAALNFGGKPYGIGIWNLPFLKSKTKNSYSEKFDELKKIKKQFDPQALVNQSKFINSVGRKIALRIFKKSSSSLLERWVNILYRGKQKNKRFSFFTLGRLMWIGSKKILPRMVPPGAKSERNRILEITSSCAECDSCERVCPTSDVFGLYGLATPIIRRKTANRIAKGINISQEEAMGFLICTRCDNCTRVCPTNIPLTDLFDLVEETPKFKKALGLNDLEKHEFIDRFWQVTKDSPIYKEHTLADHKGQKSHLGHGLKIHYDRGFPYAKLFIDPETCIHCGMCADENACTYDAREGLPRQIPLLKDKNCSLCNACINYCPQNKVIQNERTYLQELINHSVDLDEKRYWSRKKQYLRDTTTIQRASELTEMADIYVTEDILMEIDKEASTGNIPVSGMGQGDRHMGIGFDAERFSHFHIVGPAQNRLHEGDPDEELSVILGKRHRYCKFDSEGNMHNPPYPKIKLKTPILYNTLPLDSNGRVELAVMKVCEQKSTLMVMELNRMLEYYDFLISEGKYKQLPGVIIPRVDHELIHRLLVNPHTQRDFLMDLWRMPMFEITYHPYMQRTIDYINDSVKSLNGKFPLLCGYIYVAEHHMIGGREVLPVITEIVDAFLAHGVDVIHIDGLRNEDNYFMTSQAVRSIHHYLLKNGRRHEVALMASGGIRLASDSQKTIQRGAEATLIDFTALLALDSYAYRAINEKQTATEKLLNLDIDWAVKRLSNQMESRKVQILEVLGAAGFKDLKKTVGEEGRLIDFYELEERIQKNIFEDDKNIEISEKLNKVLIEEENIPAEYILSYDKLTSQISPLKKPHDFYNLSEINQKVYQRDHVWPGWVIESLGRMASGDLQMLQLKNVKGTGLLGDGFDVMKILYMRDPDMVPQQDLDKIITAMYLDKDLFLQAPWMFGGKSVGSIGLDTWKSHVIASRVLGIQFDTGEGGYPTCFFLNRHGEPIFISEPDIQLIKSYFEHDNYYTIKKIKEILKSNSITKESHPDIYNAFEKYPDLQKFLFYVVVGKDDEPFVSTELKTGLFGVTKETIKKAKRVVIAYSQGAKMGIGGHILAQKVNKLVSYLRGIEGLEYLNIDRVQKLSKRIEKIEKIANHPLNKEAKDIYPNLLKAQDDKTVFTELKQSLWNLQQHAYTLNEANLIDPIDFENIVRLCEEVIGYSYTSIISPFPFHNCYSIEDVKAFIDVVRMINPEAVISVKVSPSVDIEFIAAGLGRIAKDNSEEAINTVKQNTRDLSIELSAYAKKYGMKIELWLDGPRGGTGASPNIIKGQMGMHIEYAIPLIHHRLVMDGLRNYVKFFVSGGIRTYEDVIKAIALGADGVIWGTAPLVSIGCDRNRNCHDGCSRGIATSNLIMQNLRDVEINSRQIINAFTIMQMQVMRALAGLRFKDIRELRGRHDKIQWIGLKERVDFRIRQRREFLKNSQEINKMVHANGQSNCGVAAIIGTERIPSYILDETLSAMKNRGMDGVGIAKALCFPDHPHHYAYRIMVKGMLQLEMEEILSQDDINKIDKTRSRQELLKYRFLLIKLIRKVFLKPYFKFDNGTEVEELREYYKPDKNGKERDYRDFGDPNTDPGDIFCFFVRVKEEILHKFIVGELLSNPRYAYIREYFPDINNENFKNDKNFLTKAEDLFVFDHSVLLSQILYVWVIQKDDWVGFIEKKSLLQAEINFLKNNNPLSLEHINSFGEIFLRLLQEFAYQYRQTRNKEKYISRAQKIATVMSAGKNFAVWKTAGREIPWDTPASPNNLIHVRLATGSIVEQMNAHPFAKLHTALTHNGETTNYETLKQRVEQFGLAPLATTDTEVASLKFHLLADELEYPEWALFESFSPTTGDDLALIAPEFRIFLEEVQRVEFTSSPDGPYQYLCLRHVPEKNITERVDLKDPADLRPSTTAFWIDKSNGKKRAFSAIASEEQALQHMFKLLDKEGLVDGAAPDKILVSNGMISRYHYDNNGDITDVEFIDRYGQTMLIDEPGKHYSIMRTSLEAPVNKIKLSQEIESKFSNLKFFMRDRLAEWDFNTYRWVLEYAAEKTNPANAAFIIDLLTYLINYIRTLNTGDKSKGSMLDIARFILFNLFDRLPKIDNFQFYPIKFGFSDMQKVKDPGKQAILIDASGFKPEGTDPNYSLALLLSKAYRLGWRKFILYRVSGQRLISPAVMGSVNTDDVVMDVYGTPGEYLGAFMQGGTLRVHENAQNFAAMCMHHGDIQIFGNAGKVCGYASKGGKIFILGNINDRAWTNSVNDFRCQNLQVHILGSASKYAGESLMGGDFFFGGLYFDPTGKLCLQERPYRGTKLLGGASRGRFLFFDPNNRLDPRQYVHGKIEDINTADWKYWEERIKETWELAGIEIVQNQNKLSFIADKKEFTISPENFKLIIPKGGLKGYESH